MPKQQRRTFTAEFRNQMVQLYENGKSRAVIISNVRIPTNRVAEFKPHKKACNDAATECTEHLRKCWCIPPKQNAAFVAVIEDVLEV